MEELRKYQADVMVVIAFGQILPKSILEMTPYGCINVHASLLPKYRGAAPIQWAIINGESVTGVTTMQMDEGLDTGDMIQKTEVEITPDETGESLHDKLAAAGAALCVETLKAVETHTATFEKQEESPTAYARMLDKKLGNIDWSRSAVEIERLVRGLNSRAKCLYSLGRKGDEDLESESRAGSGCAGRRNRDRKSFRENHRQWQELSLQWKKTALQYRQVKDD